MILTTAYNTRLQSPGAKLPVRVYNRWGFWRFLTIWRAHSPDWCFSGNRLVKASRSGRGSALAYGIIKSSPIPCLSWLGWICRPRKALRKLFFAAIVSPVRGGVGSWWSASWGTARLRWGVPRGIARLCWGAPWATARLCWGVPWGITRWPGGFCLRLVAQHRHGHLCFPTMGRERRKSGWGPWKHFGRIWFGTGRSAFRGILRCVLKHSTIRHSSLIFWTRFYRDAWVDRLDRRRWRSRPFLHQISRLVRNGKGSLLLRAVCWPPPLSPADKLTGSAPTVWRSIVPRWFFRGADFFCLPSFVLVAADHELLKLLVQLIDFNTMLNSFGWRRRLWSALRSLCHGGGWCSVFAFGKFWMLSQIFL